MCACNLVQWCHELKPQFAILQIPVEACHEKTMFFSTNYIVLIQL